MEKMTNEEFLKHMKGQAELMSHLHGVHDDYAKQFAAAYEKAQELVSHDRLPKTTDTRPFFKEPF